MRTQILKRMFSKLAKPVLGIAAFVSVCIGVDYAARAYLDWEQGMGYWLAFMLMMFTVLLGWAYEWAKQDVAEEQRKLLDQIQHSDKIHPSNPKLYHKLRGPGRV